MPVKKIAAPFYEKLSLVLVGLIALGYLVILGKDFLDPLVFGFLFAVLLLPVSNFLEKKLRLPRSASSFISILALAGLISGVIYVIGSQIGRLADDWPMLKKQISSSVLDLQNWIESTFHVNMEKQMDYVHSATSKIVSSGTQVAETTVGAVSSLLLFFIFI